MSKNKTHKTSFILFIIFLLNIYVARKYPPNKITINDEVNIILEVKSILPNIFIILFISFNPNILCIIATIKGNPNAIAI